MARLKIERQNKLEPKRMETAIQALWDCGIKIHYQDDTNLQFYWKGKIVNYWPYSGWHTGSTIKDGRGLTKLIKQLK